MMSVAASCLCLAVDGMDQAKFKMPRVRSRQSKLFQKLFRPRLHVAATWAHGHNITFAVADEDTRKDSVAQCELIGRAIDHILLRCGGLPHGCVVQMDNTAREGKNQFFMAFLAMAVALGSFRWTIANYLRVGHRLLTFIKILLLLFLFWLGF